MLKRRLPYEAPMVRELNANEVPAAIRDLLELEVLRRQNKQTMEVGRDHRYITVSEAFARQLGFRVEELVGRTVEEITAPNTVDVDMTIGAVQKLGELDGLWMFKHRLGRRILVHYHAWAQPDKLVAECETILVTG